MARQAVKSIGVWSVFKFTLIYYLLFFLVFMIFTGLIFLVFALFGTAMTEANKQVSTVTGMLGGGLVTFIIVFVVGLISSIFYAAVAAIGAAIYNLIALMSGGIELNLVERVRK